MLSMQSRPLRQTIDVVLDTMGMRGPVKRRDVAEEVLRSAPEDYWSIGDLREARLAYLQGEIATRMAETHSAEYIERYLTCVPDKYRAMLRKVPRFICISPRGGRDSEHVMTFAATPEHWAANYALKDHVVQATVVSRDHARDIHDLLTASGAKSLMELLGASEAAE